MAAQEPADLLIEARWVLPMAPGSATLVEHTVAVRDGSIVALGPRAAIAARFAARERLSREHHVLLPGFVNAHTHAAMVLLRRLPLRRPLLRWLRETIWPAEQRWASPQFVRAGTQLAVAEMLRAGITCFADMYLFPDEAARVATAARVRAAIGLPIADGATPWADDAGSYLAKAEQLWDEYKSHPWVSLYFAPHAPYTVSESTLARVRRVADELDARVAMHVHETEAEVQDGLARHGRRPLEWLDDLGLLRPGFTAVHMNRVAEEDLARLERTGTSVVACPQSNLRLGSGLCPVTELAARGIAVGLGTDGPASCGALDVLAEARAAALYAGGQGCARPADAHALLQLATLGGASALGLAHLIGSIEPGKAADLVCIDLGELACQPVGEPADALLFAATRAQVSDVWVAGRAAVAGGRLLAFDEVELRALAAHWSPRLAPAGAA